MSHVQLLVDGVQVFETGATVIPSPPQPPNPGPVTPPTSVGGELTVEGQHFPLPFGSSVWKVPGRSTNFTIEVAGGDQPIHVTITNPDGSVADRPMAGLYPLGAADLDFTAGAGSLSAWVKVPGDYGVTVSVAHSTGEETIRLSP